MLKEKWRTVSRLERVGDSLIIVACFFFAYYARSIVGLINSRIDLHLPLAGNELAPVKDYFIVLAIGVLSYQVLLNLLGAYNSMRLSSTWQLLRLSVIASSAVFIVLGAALFLLKIDLSRSFIAMFCGLVTLTLWIQRAVTLRVLRYWRRRGRNFRNVIVCGIGEQALRLAREIANRPELGIRVRAFADLRDKERVDPRKQAERYEHFRRDLKLTNVSWSGRIFNRSELLVRALSAYAIDEVIFTDVVEVMPQVEELVVVCSEQGVRTTIAADLFSVGLIKSGLSYFGGMPLIHFQTPPGDRWELALKRWIDVTTAGAMLVVLMPVFAIVAALVKLTSPGPILFRQKRVGLNGRHFDLYKFRSMHAGAEAQLEKLRELNEMSGPAFKLRNDPRVTPIGRILRRFSLDELPQLWNVLIGDMSLVGPRPPIPGEVSLYERRDRRRLSMRPGLTCTWQVAGRNEINDFDTWVRLDLEYIDNWSLARDFALLFRTIPAVLLGSGAR